MKPSSAEPSQLPSPAWKAAALALLAFLPAAPGYAQDSALGTKTSVESDFRFSMVGSSQFKERSTEGKVDGYEIGTRDVVSMEMRQGFLIRFGLDIGRYNFGVPHGAALPDKLQSAALVIGADLQLGEAWIVRVEAEPGYYGGSTRLRGGNFDVPITIGASYFVSADLQIVAGISIDPERKYPVLPGAGFRWKFAGDWTLDAILPTPRIEYTLGKTILLYAGGDLQGGTYRVDPDFGDKHGNAALNNAVVDYSQIRVGGGASWKIRPELTLEMEAGVVTVQDFDFHRADVKARSTDIPPYGGIVLKASF